MILVLRSQHFLSNDRGDHEVLGLALATENSPGEAKWFSEILRFHGIFQTCKLLDTGPVSLGNPIP